ncbi:MAG: amidohydrolase, partial [Bacilli bacterium]
ENGELLGILREQALDYLDWKPEQSVSEIKDFIKSALIDANACGLTSISTNDLNEDETEAGKILKAYQELERDNHLSIRINHQVTFTDTTILSKLNSCLQTSSFLKMGPIKLFMDGSLGGKTALLKTPYLNSKEKGILCLDLEQFEKILIYCKQHHRQIIVHAIGNEAINICLDYYKKYQDSKNSLRWGIVHVQITDEEIMKKFALQHICAFVQPPFICSDMELVKKRIPQDLISTSYLFSTLAKITPTGFGSDCPVEDFNPLLGIYAMVTRANWEYRQFYHLSERQTVEEAVLGYTQTNAYLTFEEDWKGEIIKGYAADLVVLDKDIFSIPQKEIKNVKVEMTIVNGKIVYEREKNDAKKLLF